MIRTQVYFPQSLYKELKLLATRENLTFASLVRKALIDKLKERKIRKKNEDKKSALSVMLTSLSKINIWEEKTTRYGSTDHDKMLYAKR